MLMNRQRAKRTTFNYKPEFLEVDLRIVWFGDEGPQLFDAIINVESSSAFN